MAILVTGAAGFIGYHVSRALLDRGEQVIGIDDLNPYYDPALKRARLARLTDRPGFGFREADIAAPGTMAELAAGDAPVSRLVHLAAQAGVRYSLDNPRAYVRANVDGHLEVLELARRLPDLEHLVYASSSSVYGGGSKLPFAEADRVDTPRSLYAATKRADELLTESYAHLFAIPSTGLRFFTVYGPWGRPDMAYFLFTQAILEGRPIRLFNNGDMRRDFTYVDDVVAGVLAALDRPPTGEPPHRIYNLGNDSPVPLGRLVELIEQAVGRKAELELAPMQPGDVAATWADIALARRDLGFSPTTPLDQGIARFVAWYRDHYGT